MVDEFVIKVPRGLGALGRIDVALILGSGLSAIAESVVDPQVFPFDTIPAFPRPRQKVPGHLGRLIVGGLGGRRVAAFQGRIHRYQGLSALEVAFPVRLAAALRATTLVVTNAAGAVNRNLEAGDLVLMSDQLNLTGDSPLVGWAGPVGGTPFVTMRNAFDPDLRAQAIRAAQEVGVDLVPEGVYAGLLGPAYETPAEVAMLRTLGADIVGMSTVPEVIAARALQMRVLGISLVTNLAGAAGLDHADVLERGRHGAQQMRALLIAILQRLQ